MEKSITGSKRRQDGYSAEEGGVSDRNPKQIHRGKKFAGNNPQQTGVRRMRNRQQSGGLITEAKNGRGVGGVKVVGPKPMPREKEQKITTMGGEYLKTLGAKYLLSGK